MKAKIDKNGYLELERAGKFKRQYCPFTAYDDNPNICGDWCPLFDIRTSSDNATVIYLCNQRSYYDVELTDERGAE